MPARRSPSRLVVTVTASLQGSQALTSFSQNVLFFAPFGSDCCYFARKTRIICCIQNSDFLCFQALLSFVPTNFHILYCPACRRFSGTIPNLPHLVGRGACLGQTVHSKTISIGYHRHLSLSSGKCGKGGMRTDFLIQPQPGLPFF